MVHLITMHIFLTNVFTTNRAVSTAYRAHLITKNLISTILKTLSSESWENVYEHYEINKTFNELFNKCLSIFESSFPIQTTTLKFNNNGWIINRISVSCRCKECLYILSMKSNSPLPSTHNTVTY